MKFAAVLSYVLVALVANAVAEPQFGGRQGNGRGGFGGFGGGNNNNNNGNNGNNGNNNANNNNNNGATGTDTASAAAAASSAATANNANNNNNNGNNNANNGNAQDSTTLDPSVIATGFADDGQATPADGQVASLTSTNNFINFCLTVNKPITNGQQIQSGSCNPAPMGVIAATTNMPSSKFVFPANGATIPANQAFTIQMAINKIETGNFVNAQSNYYSAPQQVNAQGDIIGHSHVVVEALDSLDQTTPLDPTKFAFFKGINGAAQNGVVTADVTDGLDAGVYRMASINSAANHQPVLVAVAQHGSLDDMVYFTVSNNAGAANNTGNNNGGNNGANNGQNNNNGANNGQNNNNNGANNAQNNNNNGRNGGFGFGGGRNGGRGRGRALRFARDGAA
ncbi:hypothetical protein ACEPAI_1189 [Sanghuangporus weigelae]